MFSDAEQSPAKAAVRGSKLSRLVGLALTVAACSFGVWASAQFKRKQPPPPASADGVSVENHTVTLASNAPQWKAIKLRKVGLAKVRSTDALPARVQIDETRASKTGAPLAGRVTRVFVALGQHVKTGTPLFTVTSPEIAGLRAEQDKAKVSLETAKTNLDRIKAMVTARAVPAKEQTQALQEYKEAQIALNLAQRKLSALRVSQGAENEFTVAAARDGVVVEKHVLPSQEVSPIGEPLVVIADLTEVWVIAEPSEADVTQVREGGMAIVSSPALPGVSVEGKVEMISAVVDPDRHTIPIRVRVDNREGILKPNMYAQVRFAIPGQKGAVEIPTTALVTDGAHEYVYVQKRPGQFSRREVMVGSVRDGMVPVLSGLPVGEIVVEDGAIFLNNELAMER